MVVIAVAIGGVVAEGHTCAARKSHPWHVPADEGLASEGQLCDAFLCPLKSVVEAAWRAVLRRLLRLRLQVPSAVSAG